nr:uncharacterized protein LOC107375876 isoform X1 [Nothobranchius furzeri]
MYSPSRPPNLCDGSKPLNAAAPSVGGDPSSTGCVPDSERNTHSRERSFAHPSSAGEEPESPSWSPNPASLDVFRRRSIFRANRRSSSGYFSFESISLPNSPLFPSAETTDQATQTPSLTGQVMNHALHQMAVGHGEGPGTHALHGNAAAPSSTQEQNAMTAMEARTFGRHLRNIGDDYNRLLLRRMEDPRRRNIVPPNFLPLIHPEPVAMLCVSLLIILIGRLMYSQGRLYDQNNSQV